jgi:Domain of unknown function (DUF6458)
MAIGTSLFLLAAGAILTFAVTATVAGIDIEVVGIILMVIGGLGLVLSLYMLNRSRTSRVERRYYDEGPPR